MNKIALWIVAQSCSYDCDNALSYAKEQQNKKIGTQCVRVATAFLFALVCEYDVVEYVQLF